MSVPQELTEFLLELAVAVNRYGTYPPGHPSLATSCKALAARVAALLEGRATLSIGVARKQLVVEGVPTDESHPLLRSLAERLHREHLGALVISRGADASELHALLQLLGAAADATGQPLGLGDPARLRVAEHVRCYRLSFEQLELIADGDGDGGDQVQGTQLAQLWVGLARAALARVDEGDVPEADDPALVARAINEHPAAPAYDQVIIGYLAQLARELSLPSAGASIVRRRVSGLVTSLDPRTLRRLIDMGGDAAQRQRFLHDAADALAASAVVDVVQAAAETSQQTISSSMLRLLTKLSAYSESATSASASADEGLRDQVKGLLRNWALRDPNPEAYTVALERLARTTDGVDERAASHPAEPLRIVQMALEVDMVGPAFFRAVDALIESEQIAPLLDLLDVAEPGNEAADSIWQRLETADELRHLLTTDPVDFATIDRILVRLPESTVTSLLLDRISESASRATRMGVFQRLSRRGDDVIPAVVERLRDQRWFVLRNMLALLNEIGTAPATLPLLEYAQHARPAVRREALLLALRLPEQHDHALALALADEDERVVRVGVRAAHEGGVLPPAAVPLAIAALENPAFSPELRVQLLRLFRAVRDPLALEALLRICAPGRSLLGRPKLAAKSPELLGALHALARAWRGNPRALEVLQRALASDDPEIAAAAKGGGA